MKKEQSKGWLEFRENAPGMLRNGLRRLGGWFKAGFSVPRGRILDDLRESLTLRRPAILLLLVFCAAFEGMANLRASLALGLAAAAVLTLTQLAAALPGRRVRGAGRAAVTVNLGAGFTLLAGLALDALAPQTTEALGPALPMLAVFVLALTCAREERRPGEAALDGLLSGLGATAYLCLLGALRELLGSGSLWGAPLLAGRFPAVLQVNSPAGGFLLLGLLLALAQGLRALWAKRGARV